MKAFFTGLFVVTLLIVVGGFFVMINFKTEKMEGMKGSIEKNYFFGNLVAQRTYDKEGKLNGVTKIYYNSGKMKSQWQFVDGKREGKGIHYTPDGNVKYRDEYVQGEKISRKEYDLKGNLLSEKKFEKSTS